MHDVTKFICFTHDLLHSIPQSAKIEAKEIGLQEKKIVITVLKLDLQTVIIHMMDYKNLPLDNLILVISLLKLLFKVHSFCE